MNSWSTWTNQNSTNG